MDEDRTAHGPADRTRGALIEAGWSLLDGITVGDALESLTAAEIAQKAGRSERTFWNHFRDWNHYTSALLSDMPRRGPMEPDGSFDAVAVVDEALDGSRRSELPALVRFAAQANWAEVTRVEELEALRRQLFLLSRSGAQPELAEVVGSDYYGSYIPMLQTVYQAAGARAAVAPTPPLDWELFTRTLAALSEGLVMQSVADPQKVTAELAAEVTTAVALSLLRAQEASETLAEKEADFAGANRAVAPDPMLPAIARSCRELIAQHGSLTSWTQVSERTAVPVLELKNRAQRLSVLEALAFGDPQPFEADGGTHGSDRPRRAFEGICRLVRSARKDPKCAASLLAERLCHGPDGVAVRSLIPMGADLADALAESQRAHHDRVVNVALCAALSDTASSPADVAQLACSAHPGLVLG